MQILMEDSDILVYGGNAGWLGSQNNKVPPNTKVTGDMLKGIAKVVDEDHSKGKSAVAQYSVA